MLYLIIGLKNAVKRCVGLVCLPVMLGMRPVVVVESSTICMLVWDGRCMRLVGVRGGLKELWP